MAGGVSGFANKLTLIEAPGTGTVTSVGVSGGTTGLTTSGGPVTTNGTITIAGLLVGANGGTGVANTGKTITLGGNFVTSGAFATTLTVTNTTNVTLPTSGTLVNSAVTTLSSLASIGTITTGTWNAGAVTIASGQSLQLGNAATTGLVAGALAALTNASIVIKDSTGQAYRVPCII